jgi:hypothetical protein
VSGGVKTDVTLTLISSCVVDFGGSNNLHRYAVIRPRLIAALNAGTTYQFDIFGIANPTTANILSQIRLVAGTGTTTRDYSLIAYDAYQLYTVTPAAAVTETSVALPAFSPTTIQELTNINLNINTAPSVSLSSDIGHVRLVYSSTVCHQP